MTAKPAYFPDFAMVDETDSESGQNNAVQPPSAYNSSGWSNGEVPPRNFENWLKRCTSLWLHFLDEQRAYATIRLFNLHLANNGNSSFYSGAPDWVYGISGWACQRSTGLLYVIADGLPAGSSVGGVGLKYYNGHSASRAPGLQLYQVDSCFGVSGGPSSTLLWTNATSVDAYSWHDISGVFTPVTISATQHLVLQINASIANDVITGVALSGATTLVF